MLEFNSDSIVELKKTLPVFDIVDHTTLSPLLSSYTNHYSMPDNKPELNFYLGTLEVNQQSIFAAAWEPPASKGTAIIVHGYLDHLGLFSPLIKHLLNQDLTVVCFDLPGLGLSDGERASIDDFADYTLVLDHIVKLCQQRFIGPLHSLGQSTGGAILLKHLLDADKNTAYPFASLNLLAPLLHPKGWWLNRHLLPIVAPFRKALKRRFGESSHDKDFLNFLREKDFFQPKVMPLPWFGAAEKWAKEFEGCEGSDYPVNIIQGTSDQTLDWKYNLEVFADKLPHMRLQIIEDAYHHMANEEPSLRKQIFEAMIF
jgi:alpha-beta hydrolase superfamily lysophospholipase